MHGPKIQRRTLAKGVAWAVPAVAVAAAAPAYALSGRGPTLNLLAACKSPGNSCKVRPKGYTVTAEICNPSSLPIYITDVTFTAIGTDLVLTYAPPPDLPFMVAAAANATTPTCGTYYLNASSGNSANQAFTLQTTITWSHTPSPANDPQQDGHTPVTDTFVVAATPPGCICPDGQTVASADPLPAKAPEPPPANDSLQAPGNDSLQAPVDASLQAPGEALPEAGTK